MAAKPKTKAELNRARAAKNIAERRKRNKKEFFARRKARGMKAVQKVGFQSIIASNSIEGNIPFYEMINPAGAKRTYETYQALWASACGYFKYEDEHPWYKVDINFKGKSPTEVKTPAPVPYTMEGLCLWLGVDSNYFKDLKNAINSGKRKFKSAEEHHGYTSVIQACYDTIQQRKFHGAANGAFSGNIMSWELYRKHLREGGGSGTESAGLNVIVEKESDRKLIEDIKEQLQAIDDEHDKK